MIKTLFLAIIFFMLVSANSIAQYGEKSRTPTNLQQTTPLKKSNLSYEDRKAWRAILKWPDTCEEDFDNRNGSWSGLKFWRINSSEYLVQVQCFLAAYQPSQMYLYYKENPPISAKVLSFTTYDRKQTKIFAKQLTELAGFSNFNDQTKELSIETKYRNNGDCGSLSIYRIVAGEAKLKEYRAKFECDGEVISAKDYPIIFPSNK